MRIGVLVAFLGLGIFSTFMVLTRGRASKMEIPAAVQEKMVSSIQGAKAIDLPLFWRCYNPGALDDGDGYLLVVRCARRGIKDFYNRLRHNKRQRLFITKLSKEFEVKRPYREIRIAEGEGIPFVSPEDPRLIRYRGEVYLVYNDASVEDDYCRMIHIAKLVEDQGQFSLKEVRRLNFPDATKYRVGNFFTAKTEKNWVPFVHNDQIHFVYLIEPLVVIRADLRTGICEEVSITDNPITALARPKGGPPLLPYKDRFVSLYHFGEVDQSGKKTITGNYFFASYEISSKEPFEICSLSDQLLSGRGLYQGSRKIEFPSALILEEDRVVIFWGSEDNRVLGGWIDKGDFDALLGAEAAL